MGTTWSDYDKWQDLEVEALISDWLRERRLDTAAQIVATVTGRDNGAAEA